jgi:hypothetical protein
MDALWIASPNSTKEKQGDRLFGYGGDLLYKCFTTGGAIALQKKHLRSPSSVKEKQGDPSRSVCIKASFFSQNSLIYDWIIYSFLKPACAMHKACRDSHRLETIS